MYRNTTFCLVFHQLVDSMGWHLWKTLHKQMCTFVFTSTFLLSTYLKVEFRGFRTQFFIFWRIANVFCKAVAPFTFPSAIYEGFHSSHSWQYPCRCYNTRVAMKLYLNVILICSSWMRSFQLLIGHLYVIFGKNIYSNLFFSFFS